MKSKSLFTLVLLLSITTVNGQFFNNKYFKNTSWFSNNKDSFFYKADTLRLIKNSNLAPDWYGRQKNEYAESETGYFNHWEYITLKIFGNNEMNFIETHNNTNTIKAGEMLFNKKYKSIEIYFNYKLFSSFYIVSERQVKTPSKFSEKDSLTTTELTLIRIKNNN